MNRSDFLAQRVFASVWLLACGAFAMLALEYEAAFSYEPVGPRAYPLLCLGLMAGGLIWMLVRPTPIQREEGEQPLDGPLLRKVAACVGLLAAYAGLFETLGFIPASTLVGSFIAVIYGGGPLRSVVVCTLLSLGLYMLFDRSLDVPLPLGVLESFIP